ELEHPPRAGIPYLAVRHRRRTTTVEAGATGAHDERADAIGRVEHGSRVLRREALIAVLVAVHHDLRAVRVQGVPQRLIPRVTGDVDAGDEPGLVPIGERAAPAVERERSEEHTSELQSRSDLVCRLLLEKKKNK